MVFHEIIQEIHNSHCEHDVFIYLSKWMEKENDRLWIENCELRSSLDLLRKFNDAKWHDELIGTLVAETMLDRRQEV